MRQLARTAALAASVAAVAVLGGLATSALVGMHASETAHIAASLVPAAVATVLAAVAAPRLLRKASASTRMVTAALLRSSSRSPTSRLWRSTWSSRATTRRRW